MKPYDGGPAFPISPRMGMSTRAYFAAKVMQALVASGWFTGLDGQEPTTAEESAANCARRAVLFADALLAELERVDDGGNP